VLFRQQFRHDLRVGRFAMKFAPSGDVALQHIADAAGVSIILILSDINMPGMTGLELLPKAKAARPDVPGRGGAFCQADRFWSASQRNSIRGLNAPRDYAPVRGKADMPRISRNVR
jgi:CheY-like chemotaxis protein